MSKDKKPKNTKFNAYLINLFPNRALHNYLKSKLRLENSEFNKEKIEELLGDKSVNSDTLEGFMSLLTSCELARYTPLSTVDMQNDYGKAASVINALDKQLN